MKAFVHLVVAGLCLLALTGCQHDARSTLPVVVRVMTYNIHHGRGVDARVDLERIAQVIREQNVDLVALQEVDKGTQRTEGIDIAAQLAALTGMEFVFEKNIDFQGGEYGNAILSRYPILNSANHHYKMLHPNEQRGMLSTTVGVHGQTLTLVSTHLDFRPDPAERISNINEIEHFVSSHPDHAVIMAGDFNDTPGGTVNVRMKASFTDAWEAAGDGDGFTYASEHPIKRIDYIYLFPKSSWHVNSAEVGSSEASDHLPLIVEAMLTNPSMSEPRCPPHHR